jgi:hypothetical protein
MLLNLYLSLCVFAAVAGIHALEEIHPHPTSIYILQAWILSTMGVALYFIWFVNP